MQKRSLWAPLLALSFAFHARAQFNGSIEGTVTDQSKAGVPEAQVTLIQESTQVTQRATTSESGFFRIAQLPPGRYRLEVSRGGFKTWIQTDLILARGEARHVYSVLAGGEQGARGGVTGSPHAPDTAQTNPPPS